MAKRESIVYGTILKLSGEILEEIIPLSHEDLKGLKRVRGTETFWKCNECAVPICRPERPCWNIAHRRLFNNNNKE
jgi:hypothetical protein